MTHKDSSNEQGVAVNTTAAVERAIEEWPYPRYRYPAQNDVVERDRATRYARSIALSAVTAALKAAPPSAQDKAEAENWRYLKANAPPEGCIVKFTPDGHSIVWGVPCSEAVLDELEEKAARYDWLRQMVFDDRIIVAPDRMLSGGELDDAIDTARRKHG